MLTAPDFAKKQILFVFFNEGEKLAFSNDNVVVRNNSGKIKLQCTCYRLFMIFVIGHTSITTPLIQTAKKFGFFIALMTPGFRLYSVIGAAKEGNTLLHKKQYEYMGFELARHITINKMHNQLSELKSLRYRTDDMSDTISRIECYLEKIKKAEGLGEIMAFEGLTAKEYFKNYFTNTDWKGRQPRLKKDYVNSALDVGYTLLFSFMDALLSSFGFDTYYGVMHQQFYMRKSLVCDLVEPFRPLIDHEIRKSINLKQFSEKDFIIINGQFRLKWENSAKYVNVLMQPLIDNKEGIFTFVQAYYRAFMKGLPADKFPSFEI